MAVPAKDTNGQPAAEASGAVVGEPSAAEAAASKNYAVPLGGHYSGRNRIPNIKQFMESLDREKQQRDKAIDEETKRKVEQLGGGPEARDHLAAAAKKKGKTRMVRDPVTGRDVEIEDVNIDYVKAVDEPVVSSGGGLGECAGEFS